MEEANIIGIDLAKRSFQVHGARAGGSVVYRRKSHPHTDHIGKAEEIGDRRVGDGRPTPESRDFRGSAPPPRRYGPARQCPRVVPSALDHTNATVLGRRSSLAAS